MKEKDKKNKLALLIPYDEIESEAKIQIENILELDFLKKLVILPDVHKGYDLCIGGVALLDGKISASFVGYDIGCGMCYINSNIPAVQILNSEEEKERIFRQIYRDIPVGFDIFEDEQADWSFESASGDKKLNNGVNEKLNRSLGTLGGGNHFIEIGKNRTGKLCITVHSGSRNIGHQIASFYMKKSRFFDLDSEMGEAYLKDMNFALSYALENRKMLMSKVLKILDLNPKLLDGIVNENHNHALVTEDGVLHRKGATPAELDQIGIIPGNMKDGIYITRGLGNKEFLCSASHGAGRVMSRNKAKQTLSITDFKSEMQGITAKVDRATLDESPEAYKNLDEVIKYQEGKVIEVIDKVPPLINIKG